MENILIYLVEVMLRGGCLDLPIMEVLCTVELVYSDVALGISLGVEPRGWMRPVNNADINMLTGRTGILVPGKMDAPPSRQKHKGPIRQSNSNKIYSRSVDSLICISDRRIIRTQILGYSGDNVIFRHYRCFRDESGLTHDIDTDSCWTAQGEIHHCLGPTSLWPGKAAQKEIWA